MTLLNQTSDGLLPAMLALRRAILTFGPMPRQTLEKLCAPTSLGEHIDKRSLAHITLTTWTGLGMFTRPEDKEGNVEVSPQFRSIGPDDVDGLRTAVLDLLMRPENVPSLEDGEAKASRASDFARCAAWLLAQDPYRLADKEGALVAMSDDQQTSPQVFPGSGRWAAFQVWGYFAGLGMPTALRFVMNPARAIRAILDDVLPAGVELTAQDFVRLLAHRIPVLDIGTYRQVVERQTAKPWRSYEPDKLSPSLSLALKQLHHEIELVLEDRLGDVGGRLTLLGRDGRQWDSFTHVRRGVPIWPGAARRNPADLTPSSDGG